MLKQSKKRGKNAIGLECTLKCLNLVKTDDVTEYLAWYIIGYEKRKYLIVNGYRHDSVYSVSIKDITILKLNQ